MMLLSHLQRFLRFVVRMIHFERLEGLAHADG